VTAAPCTHWIKVNNRRRWAMNRAAEIDWRGDRALDTLHPKLSALTFDTSETAVTAFGRSNNVDIR